MLAAITVLIGYSVQKEDNDRARTAAGNAQLLRERATNLAEERRIDTIQEQRRLEFLGGHSDQALIHLREVYAKRPKDEAVRHLIRAASRSIGYVIGPHKGKVEIAGLSPSGDRILTVDEEATRLWERNGRLITTLTHNSEMPKIARSWFANDRRELVTVTREGAIDVWDRDGSWLRRIWNEDPPCTRYEISADRKNVHVFCPEQVSSVPIDGGLPDSYPAAANLCDVDAAGKYIAVIAGAAVEVHDLASKQLVRRFIKEGIAGFSSVQWSGSGDYVIAASGSELVLYWPFSEPPSDTSTPSSRTSVITDSTGKSMVAMGYPGSTILLRVSDGVHEISKREIGAVRNGLLSTDGRTFFALTSDEDDPVFRRVMTITLWDMATGAVRQVIDHPDPVRGVALSDDGSTLLTASSGNLVRLWDLGAAPRAVLDEEAMLPAAVSEDGDHLVVLATDGAITRHDLRKQHSAVCRGIFDTNYREPSDEDLDMYEGQMQRGDIRAMAKSGAISSAIVLDRNATLAQIYDKQIDLDHCRVVSQPTDDTERTLNTKILASVIPGQPQVIRQIVVHGDLALVHRTGANQRDRTYAFNARSGKLLYDVDGGNPVFSPDGSALAIGVLPAKRAVLCNDRVLTYDAATGRPLAAFAEHEQCIQQLVFDPNGRRLLCIWNDTLAEMLDPQTGKLIFTFGDPVTGAAFSPTGGRIATTNEKTTRLESGTSNADGSSARSLVISLPSGSWSSHPTEIPSSASAGIPRWT